MLDAGEVGLGGEREQVEGRWIGGAQHLGHRGSVEAQLGCHHGDVRDRGALPSGELPDAVDRVVVVEREGEGAARLELVGLADQPQGCAGVGREDAEVIVRRCVEELAHRSACPLHECGRCQRRRIARVGVAEQACAQQISVGVDLACRVQPSAGVVEVHVVLSVEEAVLGSPQLGERARWIETREGRSERSLVGVEIARCKGGRRRGQRTRSARGRDELDHVSPPGSRPRRSVPFRATGGGRRLGTGRTPSRIATGGPPGRRPSLPAWRSRRW